MRSDALWQLTFTAATEAEAAVAELLGRLWGQTPVAYQPEGGRNVGVSIYGTDRFVWTASLRRAFHAGLTQIRQSGLRPGPVRCRITRLRNEDWAESWKRHFRPLVIGSVLLIKPSWSRRRARNNQSVIELGPSLSFGTGHHPTTRFCLRQIAAWRPLQSRRSLLDIGTGTGILAIAAAKLGYRPVLAFDHHPVAMRVARENARRNGVEDQVQICQQDLTLLRGRAASGFHVTCANLESDLLQAEATRIADRLRQGGGLILAGILDTQFPAVHKVYSRAGMKLVAQKKDAEWRSAAFILTQRRGPAITPGN